MSVVFDPLSNDHWNDPYAVYAQLRETAPVYRSPDRNMYCLSRYEDVELALRQAGIFSSSGMEAVLFNQQGRRPGLLDMLSIGRFMLRARVNPMRQRPPSLITEDPPKHDEMRAVVNRGFTPRRIASLEPRMREIVDGCMKRMREGDRTDVIRDLAIPLPVTVIAEMLGVDPERQLDFKRWSDALISASSGGTRDGGLRAILDPMGELRGYLRSIVRDRKANPADDLISVLVDRRHEETLNESEIFGFIALLLVAGNETTTNLIGNSTLALLSNPEELAKVQADPSLIPGMLEETLRWDAPVQTLFRQTMEDVELPGGKIPAGAQVALLIGSANRDPEVFEDPDVYKVSRSTRAHLGFGFGVHFCLGASLARMEARVAMEALVPELPSLSAAPSPLEYVDSFIVRGPRRIELSLKQQPMQ
jgi:cytochrome P450